MKRVVGFGVFFLLLLAVCAYFAKNLLSTQYTYFPDSGNRTYVGTFSDTDVLNGKIPGSHFFLARTEEAGRFLFSVLAPGQTPVKIKSREIQANEEQEGARFEPLLIEPLHECRMSGALDSGVLKGVFICKDGAKTAFSAKSSEASISNIYSMEQASYSDPEIRKLLSRLSHVQLLEEYVRELEEREFSGREELAKFDLIEENSGDLQKEIKTLGDEISRREGEIAELEKKRERTSVDRNQLFRVTERGVEVELERRLSRMEYDVLLKNRNEQDGTVRGDAFEPYEFEKPSNEDENESRSGTDKEWWKALD